MNKTYRKSKCIHAHWRLSRSITYRSAYKVFFKKAPKYWLASVPINLLFVLPKERRQSHYYEQEKLCKCGRMAFYYKKEINNE